MKANYTILVHAHNDDTKYYCKRMNIKETKLPFRYEI